MNEKWNRSFSELIRRSRPAYWGNWALNAQVQPGAIGIVDPHSGDFRLVAETLPNLKVKRLPVSNSWQLLSEKVSRTEAKTDVSGEITDPDTGVKGEAGVEVSWSMSQEGSIASEFSLREEAYLEELTQVEKNQAWLAQQAAGVGFGGNGEIAQGFGVITGVLYANSGLNVGSQSKDSAFAIAGRASAVHEMLGGATAKGSFTSVRKAKSIDKHLWPDHANTVASGPVPIAYTFASFEGKLLIPNWVSKIGGFEIFFSNQLGSTYIVAIELSYKVGDKTHNDSFEISGGLSRTVGNIPLNATDIKVKARFKGVINSDTYERSWARPLGQWLTGQRHIDMYGVWPGATHFSVREEPQSGG
jgi:hypothetical protein